MAFQDSCSSTLHVDTDNSVLKQKTNEQSVPTHSETQFISGLAGTASHSETTSLANSCIDKYFFKDDVTRAEILWCLQTVENHASISSAGKQSSLFPLMFPDSRIASSLCLARTKLSYGIVFGLAPYFNRKVLDAVCNCGPFVVSFDESLNKMTQTQQMDIALRFWNNNSNQVETHYFSSAFLGHARAKDLLRAFKEELKDLNLQNLLQVSMDGPNVNWAFLKELECDIRSTYGENSPIFINMGSCGLHIVNNSYKEAAKSTGWNVIAFLRSAYYVFKDVPSRRSDYLRFNKSQSLPLPAKFCSVRWLENEKIIETTIKIIPNLKNFINGVKEEKIKITSKSFGTMKSCLEDKLLTAKLSFFGYVAHQVTPFLKEYQCKAPMSPFLYNDLYVILHDLMSLIVKEEVLDKQKAIYNIDLRTESNLIPSKNLKLGHAVRAELKKLKISDKEMMLFKTECREFLVKMCIHLLKKSPLQYSICKAICFCDPMLISSNLSISKNRLSNALELFSARNWITSQICDKIEKEFNVLCNNKEVIDLCKQFVRENNRIDHFWRNLLQGRDNFQNLYVFLKKIFILSHGQAFVERGFSINKECSVENQLPRSLISQRQVYDGLKAAGGLTKLTIDKKMILSYRNARDMYGKALEKQLSEKEQENAKIAEKRSLFTKISELKAKKVKLLTDKTNELSALDDEIALLRSKTFE